MQDIKKYVVDKGKSQAPKDEGRRGPLQPRRLQLDADRRGASRNAQKLTGKKVVTGEDVRRGLETLNLDAARLKALGLEGFAAPLKLTCADHNGHSADLRPAMGRHEMGQGHRPDRPR